MVRPKSNLPPDAQPWGRNIEDEVDRHERILKALEDASLNNNKGTNATLAKISDQLAAIADLTSKQAAQLAAIAAQQTQINATIADLAARTSTTTNIPSFNSGVVLGDATPRWIGSDINVTVDVPTGNMLVMVGCGECSLNTSGSTTAIQGMASFSIPGLVTLGTYYSRNYAYGADIGVGSPLSMQRAISVPPGTYTITGKMGTWSNGPSVGSIQFNQPFLTVQVTA